MFVTVCQYWHFSKTSDYSIVQQPGKRARGRKRKRWMDNLSEWLGISTERLLRETEDRRGWRRIVHNATNPHIEDG